MEKRNIHWKWIALIAGVTAIAIAATLAICLLGQQEALCAPGFTYDGFITLYENGNIGYVASPDGNVYAMRMGEGGISFLSGYSLDQKTMLSLRTDGTILLVGPDGTRTLERKGLPSVYSYPAYLSFYGDVVYYFAKEDTDANSFALWRYDVAGDTAVQWDTLSGVSEEAVVSPNGNAFAVMDQNDTVHIYLMKQGAVTIETRSMPQDTSLLFLTDTGVLFFYDLTNGLQSVRDGETPYRFPLIEAEDLTKVLFNKDATEMLVNTSCSGCYLCVLKDGVVQKTVWLKDLGTLDVYACQSVEDIYVLWGGTADKMQMCGGTHHAVFNVDSFQALNLMDTASEERVKLTADYTLAYQENSNTMHGELATSGKYVMYTDANGDYFYTDTEDVEGRYHLLWETSAADVRYILFTTGQKSFYYVDQEGNLCYHSLTKDSMLADSASMESAKSVTVEDATDTLYYIFDNAIYYSHAGARPRKVATLDKLFPENFTEVALNGNTAAGMYCYAVSAETGEPMIYRLYADGSYRLMQ